MPPVADEPSEPELIAVTEDPAAAALAAVQADAPRYARLALLLLDGALARPSGAGELVELMAAAATPGLRHTLATAVAASAAQPLVPAALVEAGAFSALAGWVEEASSTRHITVLLALLAAAAALPAPTAAVVAPLAQVVHRLRQLPKAPAVAAAAARLLAS